MLQTVGMSEILDDPLYLATFYQDQLIILRNLEGWKIRSLVYSKKIKGCGVNIFNDESKLEIHLK